MCYVAFSKFLTYVCVTARTHRLKIAIDTFNFFADGADTTRWMEERRAAVRVTPPSTDLTDIERELKQLRRLQVELDAYKGLADLHEQAAGIAAKWDALKAIANADVTIAANVGAPATPPTAPATPSTTTVQARYKYEGRRGTELSFAKGERMELVAKSTAEWWKVKNADGKVGYVPAAYVTTLETPVVRPVATPPDLATKQKSRLAKRRTSVEVIASDASQADTAAAARYDDVAAAFDDLQAFVRDRVAALDAARVRSTHAKYIYPPTPQFIGGMLCVRG